MSNDIRLSPSQGYIKAVAIVLACILLLLSAGSVRAVNNVTIGDNSIADWADETCQQDVEGAEDEPGTKDVTRLCIASNFTATAPAPANLLYLRMDFDETVFTGNDSLDGCAVMDSDGDGGVDRALCITLAGNPATISIRYFTCNDSKTDRCAGSSQIVATTSTCSLVSTTPTFGTGGTADTAVECSVAVSELGLSSASTVQMNMCSFPSTSPNSNAFDCALASTRLFANTATGVNGQTTPTAIALVSFSGAPGSGDIAWYGLVGVIALVAALALWRRQRSFPHALG